VRRTWAGIRCLVLDVRRIEERSCGDEMTAHGVFEKSMWAIPSFCPSELRGIHIQRAYITQGRPIHKG